jgi:hypothetical protein
MLARLRALALLLLLCALAATVPARAHIAVHFYSSEQSGTFPHAFILISGRLASSGRDVSANYGFTAARVTPTILRAPTAGYVQQVRPAYIAGAHRHFTIRVNDRGYARLMARVAVWQRRPQPSYDLTRANCVHFVMDLARTAGLSVNKNSEYLLKPRRFLNELQALNPGVI